MFVGEKMHMEKKYIEPRLILADKIESINKHINKPEQFEYLGHADDRKYKKIVFNVIQELEHLIVLGEPGCGKSELLTQLIKYTPSISINLLQKEELCITDETDLICFDALDEVSNAEFSDAVYLIADTAQKYPSKRIIVTCRTHYINANISLIIASLSNFKYLLIDKFDEDHIVQYVNSTDLKDNLKSLLTSKLNTNSNKQLKRILQIPRYLTELCKVIQDNSITKEELEKWKRADFFEKAIYNKIETELKKDSPGTVTNELYISKRMLEKLALILEIKRVNKISIDEFLSFIDETDSNISHVFLSTVNLSKFYDRTLKKTGSYLEFDNTEFQEYLAAKEILRQGNKEQIIYDLLFDKDFEHIYSNWYDVLRFIVELNPEILLFLSKFVLLNNKGWSDENFLKLVKEIDPETLDESQKSVLFKNIYTYFQSHELYIHDFTQILTSLYTVESAVFFEQVVGESNSVSQHFRIYNQFKLVCNLIAHNHIPNKSFWQSVFKQYALGHDESMQCAGLYAMMDIEDNTSLIQLSNCTTIISNPKTYATYITTLQHTCPNDDTSISLFLKGMKDGVKEAIFGLMQITNPDKFIPIFEEIIQSDELTELFFNRNIKIWSYQLLLERIKEMWNSQPKIKSLAYLIFKKILLKKYFHQHHSIEDLFINLTLWFKKKNNEIIFKIIEWVDDPFDLTYDRWILQTAISRDQINRFVELSIKKYGERTGKNIVLDTLQNIRSSEKHKNKDANKIYEEGRLVFPSEYKNWETVVMKNDNTLEQFSQVINSKISQYKSLDINEYFVIIEELYNSKSNQSPSLIYDSNRKHLKEIVNNVLEFIDFSQIHVNRVNHHTWHYSTMINYFNYALAIGCRLDMYDEIKSKFYNKILCYLPISNGLSYYNSKGEIVDFCTTLSSKDYEFIYDFLSRRKDDYIQFDLNIIFDNIRRYKLTALNGFIKKVILESIDDFFINDAIKLLAESFFERDESFFIDIWKSVDDKTIRRGSKYDIANEILITVYNNKEAQKWRFKFLENNIYEFTLYDFNGLRGVSINEAEMDRPSFCNCFIESKRHDYVDFFFELIEFSLKINTERKFQKYSEYLQTMSLEYFKAIDDRENVIKLRKIANNHSNKHAAEDFLRLLKELELFYVNKESNINIYQAIYQYNKIKTTKYKLINNTTDLYYLVQNAISDFVNTIENEGLYRPINFLSSDRYPNEDLLQKTLKLSLENSLFKYGIREIDIIRESNLYDDKRTDILVKYGFIGPIMIELKLLDNDEIQNEAKMKEYKGKLKQYIQAYHCDYSFYLIFQRKQSNDTTREKYQNMTSEYSDISNLNINFIDCYIDKLYMDRNYNCSNPKKRPNT